MLRFLADENFNQHIIAGLLQREPALDIVSVQDVGLAKADDPTVLAWAADEERVLLTHDVQTMTKFAYERTAAGQAMPGIYEVALDLPLRIVIEDILLIAQCSLPGEWEGQVRYLPLR